MKNLNWKQWTGIGVIAAVVIIFVIMHLVQPQLSYAWHECIYAISFILGAFASYMVCRKSPKASEKQLLTD